jgi:hypothetical protein
MNIRLKIDRAGFATVFRTLAALLIGNGLVVPVLTDGKSHYWWVLLLVGLFFMMVTNIKVERGQT